MTLSLLADVLGTVFRRRDGAVEVAADQPVRVLVAGSGKQLFDHVRDPRMSVTRADRHFDGEADLIVLPCRSSEKIAIEEIGPFDAAWQAARAGRARVVFDASTEGDPHSEGRTTVLHGFLAQKGLPPGRAIYLTQDRDYRREYLEFCARSAVDQPMTVVLDDYFIWSVTGELKETGQALFAERLRRFRDRGPKRPRRFMSLNYTPRSTKVLFLTSLMRDGLWDQGYISFGGFDKNHKTDGGTYKSLKRLIGAADGFEDLACALSPWLKRLYDYGEVVFSRPPTKKANPAGRILVRDQDIPEFDDCWFSIVTETEMRPRASRITEKPLKALSNFHPFVIFGNVGALRLVRELGFSTFGDVIDESYDDEPDPRRRFDLAYAEVRRLCALDETELGRLTGRIADRLEHNARHALVKMPGPLGRRHDAELIDQILAAGRTDI